MLNQVGGSKTDTLVKLVLVFFISLLSFSVGTFVGKQFSDSQHKMASLEGEDGVNRDTASVDEKALDVKPEDALTDEDVAQLADEFVKSEKTHLGDEIAKRDNSKEPKHDHDRDHNDNGADHQTTEPQQPHGEKTAKEHRRPASKPVAAKTDDHTADAVAKTADKVAHGESTDEKKTLTKKIDKSLPAQVASDTGGKYTVQLSSHNNQEDAEKMATEYKSKGYSAFYVPAKIKETTWYRVSVGLFGDKKAAEDYRKKLIADGTIKAAIVQRITDH